MSQKQVPCRLHIIFARKANKAVVIRRLLADFNDQKPEPVVAPAWARKW